MSNHNKMATLYKLANGGTDNPNEKATAEAMLARLEQKYGRFDPSTINDAAPSSPGFEPITWDDLFSWVKRETGQNMADFANRRREQLDQVREKIIGVVMGSYSGPVYKSNSWVDDAGNVICQFTTARGLNHDDLRGIFNDPNMSFTTEPRGKGFITQIFIHAEVSTQPGQARPQRERGGLNWRKVIFQDTSYRPGTECSNVGKSGATFKGNIDPDHLFSG